MNERIQNLAIQAAGKGFNTFSTSDLDTQEKIERFAELIVRECMDVVSTCNGTTKFDHWTAIKEHFGVKE